MKATEIIKQYNLKYDTETNCYRAVETAPENSDKIIYSLHEDDANGSVYFCKQVYHPDKINPKTLAYGVFGNPKFTFGIENDLPALEHWVRDEKDNFHCSRCGAEACCLRRNDDRAYMVLTSFCYHCGAKMDIDYDESENE